MKFIFKRLFRKNRNDEKLQQYDIHIDFYYTNLVNSLILFSLKTEELKKLITPTFNPMFELEAGIEEAFTPILFETIFRNKKIDIKFKNELIEFKKDIDNIPSEIWDWDLIDTNINWINIRTKANILLNKIGIEDRIYCDDYEIVHGKNGNISQF